MPQTAAADSPPRILVLDDDPDILQTIASALRDDGYEVSTASDGDSGRTAVEAQGFDLIILDLMLPDADGLLLCSDFTRMGNPVLACSATKRHRDGTLALRLGADGFVSKPFDLNEFLARVARIVASRPRQLPSADEGPRPGAGNLRVDQKHGTIRVGANELQITPTEFRLFFALAKASGRVLTRVELAAATWGYQDPSEGRTIDVHLGRLRSKLKAASADVAIAAVRGEGYALVSHESPLQQAA